MGDCGDGNESIKDSEKLVEATQRFVKAWGEAITEQFKSFNEGTPRHTRTENDDAG